MALMLAATLGGGLGADLSAGLGAVHAQGVIRVDGSSTVYPISLAMAEEFSIDHPRAPVAVSFSGTGAGLGKLCSGESDVANASRVITASELAACAANGLAVYELPVAIDAITVVVNPANDWVRCLTITELSRVWQAGSTVNDWSEVRAGFPAVPLTLYGPGTDSGTFDYFTEAVNGAVGAVRTDFLPSEDDNILVRGVEGDSNAMGFFGYAYYALNRERLRAVAIDGGGGCVLPDGDSITTGAYEPLARPLLIYVSSGALKRRPAVAEFVHYYLAPEHRVFITETGYVPYSDDVYRAVLERFEERVTGSAFQQFAPGDNVLDAVRRREP